MQKDMPLGFG
uniref:Uncharacterized protein n=1 Tax=Arundo donax TaxID=35708 RepID=A0A0A9GTG2_ARUDO